MASNAREMSNTDANQVDDHVVGACTNSERRLGLVKARVNEQSFGGGSDIIAKASVVVVRPLPHTPCVEIVRQGGVINSRTRETCKRVGH
jgi:hypothetical protein